MKDPGLTTDAPLITHVPTSAAGYRAGPYPDRRDLTRPAQPFESTQSFRGSTGCRRLAQDAGVTPA